MDVISGLVKNSLCLAFNTLCDPASGCVPKSRLLVFAASLGNRLRQENVEKGLPEYRSTQHLKFLEFFFYLEKELLTAFPKDISPQHINKIHYDIDDVCWLVCKHEFYVPETNSYPENYYFKLFRLFCALADFMQIHEVCTAVLNAFEVQFLTESFDKLLGSDIESTRHFQIPGSFNDCSFSEFIKFMDVRYVQCYEKGAILEATDEVYDVIVENNIKKGYLKKLLTPVGPWWEMWFVLNQHTLSWSSSKAKKEHWGEINFSTSKVQIENGTGTQFSLIVDYKTMVLNASDCASKLQWMAAIHVALKHSETLEPFQQLCAAKRRQARKEAEAKMEEEKQLLLDKEEALEAQKKDKMQLELVLQKETERLKDMELREKLLITQLEEERLAKRDEEIVRNLQSRLLAEEWERREMLEKQHLEKEAELHEERQKREQLENWQREREAEIDQLANVVSSLEKEKEQLHGTLKRTKIMLIGNANNKPLEANDHQNLKRSFSTDLSHVHYGKWSLPSSTSEAYDRY